MFVYGLCNLYLPFGLVQFAGGDSVCGQEVKIVTMGALYQQTGNAMQIQGIFLRFALCLFRASGWNANHAVRRERERTRREGGRDFFFAGGFPTAMVSIDLKNPTMKLKHFPIGGLLLDFSLVHIVFATNQHPLYGFISGLPCRYCR